MASVIRRGLDFCMVKKLPTVLFSYQNSRRLFSTRPNTIEIPAELKNEKKMLLFFRECALKHPESTIVAYPVQWYADKNDIQDAFLEYGDILDIQYPFNQNGFPKGIAKIMFKDKDALAKLKTKLQNSDPIYIAGDQVDHVYASNFSYEICTGLQLCESY